MWDQKSYEICQKNLILNHFSIVHFYAKICNRFMLLTNDCNWGSDSSHTGLKLTFGISIYIHHKG